MNFKVFRKNGTEVKIGDLIISFRGDTTTFTGCKHPRKIQTSMMGCEKYPSVFDLQIRGYDESGNEVYVWN